MTDQSRQRRRQFQEILAKKRAQLEARKVEVPVEDLRAQAHDQVRGTDIAMALRGGHISMVAEVKRTTATGQVLVHDYDPVALAQMFELSGAAAISVTTDETLLHGGLEHLAIIKYAVQVPVLRQDFIFDEYQIIETRAVAADGMRLITGILDDKVLRNLLTLTQRMRMTALIEVHNRQELERVLPLEPRLIGINHRDWGSAHLDLELTAQLRDAIPPHMTVISEGGIKTPAQVRDLSRLGIDAFVVGEAVLTADDISAKVAELAST